MTVLNVLIGVLTLIIGLSIMFHLLNVPSVAPFVRWIYATAESFVFPFRGIAPNLTFGSGGYLDLSAAIALLIYDIAAYFITSLIDGLLARRRVHAHTETI